SNDVSFLSTWPPFFLAVRHNGRPHSGYGRFYWRDSEHGHDALAFVVCAVQVAPRVGFLGFGVSRQGEHLNTALPDCLAAKDLMDWDGFDVLAVASVQVPNRHRKTFDILF